MAETYQPTGSNIGTLLRLIAEEKTQNATLLPPATTPDSPLREVVQQPLKSSESPGSSRVVSIRPESAAPIGPITPDTSTVVAPVAPPVAPEAPVGPTPVPTPTPAVSSGSAAPSIRSSAPVPTPVPTPTPGRVAGASTAKPSIGTVIKDSPLPFVPNSFNAGRRFQTPQKARVGDIISNPKITPVPQSGYVPGRNSPADRRIQDVIRKIQTFTG